MGMAADEPDAAEATIHREGRVAAVDYGRRRMGIAVCDREQILASPSPCGSPARTAAWKRTSFAAWSPKKNSWALLSAFHCMPMAVRARCRRKLAALLAGWPLQQAFLSSSKTNATPPAAAAGRLAGVGLSRGSKKARSDAVAARNSARNLDGSTGCRTRHTSRARPVVSRAHATPHSGPKRRLVAGCGALGMRVARRWIAAGDQVWGTTRSRRELLIEAGIVPIVADLGSDRLPALPEVDTVFWAVGFDRRSETTPHDLHVGGLARLLDAVPSAVRVVLSSSTGVWGDGDGELVDEQTPVCPSRPSAVAIVEAETMLRRHPKGPGVALRFAGLYGPERLPRLDDLRAGREITAGSC